MVEEEGKSELTIEEFEQLSDEQTEGGMSQIELLAVLEGKALSTGAVSEKLGKTHGTAYSRLKRLLSKGLVQRRYLEKSAFWTLSDEGKRALEAGEIPEE